MQCKIARSPQLAQYISAVETCNLADLHVVERLQVVANAVHLVIVDPLQISQGVSHLVLPELAVLICRIAVRQSRKLLQLLFTDTCTGMVYVARSTVT